MRWFRTNRGLGGRLALFALAVQFVLSFGHIHREDIYGSARFSFVGKQLADSSKPLPANQPSQHSDDYCAICATVSLLSGSVVATAPQLPTPQAFHFVARTDRVTAAILAERRFAFQSRAPPAV